MDAASVWQEFRHSDGRLYYFNSVTKATQWTKPPDLMNPTEVSARQHFLNYQFAHKFTACPLESALERVHGARRSKVLVQ